MASEKNLQELFHETLKDIYFAEKKILSALPDMAEAAQSQELKAAFELHETETEEHVARLEKVFKEIDETPSGKTCDAIIGIIKEGQEVMKEFKDVPALDAGLLAAAQGRRALRDRPLRDTQNVGRRARLERGGEASGDDAR
jgi:ferritin-like metal-binding protein YciE